MFFGFSEDHPSHYELLPEDYYVVEVYTLIASNQTIVKKHLNYVFYQAEEQPSYFKIIPKHY